MGMPIEDQAREVVANNSELNIHRGRIAAYKALMTYLETQETRLDAPYVPDLPVEDQRLEDVNMTSYNSIRNSWIAMYEHWKYPDIFVTVQCDRGVIYTMVDKHVHRSSDLSQATLW